MSWEKNIKENNIKQKFIIKGELPTLNEMIDDARSHWAISAKSKKENDMRVRLAIKKAKIKKFESLIDIDIKFFCKDRRKDKDNIMAGQKYILDGLVQSNIIPNDGWKYIGNITHTFEVDKDSPRVEVTITESK